MKKTRKKNTCKMPDCHSGNAIYGLGFIGASIYYISIATSFWIGLLGILKAMVWPIFLIYGLLKFLGL